MKRRWNCWILCLLAIKKSYKTVPVSNFGVKKGQQKMCQYPHFIHYFFVKLYKIFKVSIRWMVETYLLKFSFVSNALCSITHLLFLILSHYWLKFYKNDQGYKPNFDLIYLDCFIKSFHCHLKFDMIFTYYIFWLQA